jgi:chromosome segregation ATPase
MNDPRAAEATALRLAELSHEIDELESSRAALLRRVESLRSTLLNAGNRTTNMRASVDLLCEHIAGVVTAMAELRALEAEIRDLGVEITVNSRDTVNLAFEADSLGDTLDEAEEEMEQLSAILTDRKGRHSRGH